MYANTAANYSAGTQINRMLDALGYPDKFGDAIGALVDIRTGNIPGAVRNLVDLNSGLSTRSMDRLFGGGPRAGFNRAFFPRLGCQGGHLVKHQHTYAVREQVGKRASVGQRYGYNWGPFKLQGRISGFQYAGSFAKPIKLANNQYLYRGRTYPNLGAIARDARDGRVDGQATTYRTHTHYHWRPGCSPVRPFFPPFLGISPIFGGGNTGGTGNTGNTGGTGGTGSTGGSVLSDPSLSLEDKLALLMSKLSKHLDDQINKKMGAIEQQMAKEKGGNAGGSGKSGGIGGILGGIGKAVGTAFGGPFGGLIGKGLGGILGGGGSSTSGAGGANGSKNGQSSNLQLLQSQLQTLLQKRQQMFQTMSNIMKSLHDTSMNTIRQLKA